MKDNLYDLWIRFRVYLNLPSIDSYYKGRKLSMRKYWYCTTCKKPFSLDTKHMHLPISQVSCSWCQSKSHYHCNRLSKALIDKKSTDELMQIIEEERRETAIYQAKTSAKK